MPLDEDQVAAVKKLVWSGMHSRSRIVEILTEELYYPQGGGSPIEVGTLVDTETRTKIEQEKSWPVQTDCDRLEFLFASLNKRGVAAVMNAGFDTSDGFDQVDSLCSQRGGPGPQCFGFCFYHTQDMERAQDGGGLYLAFGDFSGKEDKGVAIGKLVASEARACGFTVVWDETSNRRILLRPFNWQKRGFPKDNPCN